MERITNLVKQGLVIYGAVEKALIRYYHVLLGMALGMLIGILFVPVYFRPNAVPAQMDDTYREQWIKDTANGYQYVVSAADALPDSDAATTLRANAEAEVQRKLTDVGATTSDIDSLIQNNEDNAYLVNSLNAVMPFVDDDAATEQKEDYSEGPPGAIVRALTTLGIFALFGILGLLVTIVFKLWDIPFLKQIRNLINPREEDPALAAARARKRERERAASMRTTFDKPPVVQFTTSYLKGDNYYDDSFAIEVGDPDDHKRPFLGECGAGISKAFKATAIGDKQVVATEIFLFDKVDGATITNVLLSPTAYQDEELRAELAPRGELHMASVGDKFMLETQTLQAQVTVLDIEYDETAEKPDYVFGKVTVEIAVWQKEGAPGAINLSGSGSDDDFVMPKPIIDFPMDDEPVAPPPVRQEVRPLTPADIPPQQPPMQQMPPQMSPQMPPQMPPQQQPITPPPTQQTTQAMPPQMGDMTQPRQPFPAQPPQQPQQRQPFPAQPPQQQQAYPPQMPPQQPPMQQMPPQMPPQGQGNRPPATPQQGQRPPVPPAQGGRPPIAPQGGQRPPIPQQGQGNRPPVPPQGQGNYPPMPPQRRAEDDSPFGDTGDFNL